jgi:hypothetical protein
MPVDCRRTRPGAAFVLRALITAAFALLVVSCGGKNTLSNGTPIFTVTATNSRFTSFVVNIDSMTLTRDDGNTFTSLGTIETTDLTKQVDLTELLGAPAFPSGTYKQGTITLDFTYSAISADIAGTSTSLAPVDTTGLAIRQVTLNYNFDPNHPLVINYQAGTRVGLEFDLAASTIINPATSTVTLTPVVVASTVPANNNPVRVNGAFLIADPSSSSFILNSRPFADVTSSLGAINVTTDSNTVYDLSGVTYSGAAGLAAVQKLGLNSPIAAIGTLTDISKVTPVMHATQVYAGASLEAYNYEHIEGIIGARSGNTLTVKGSVYISFTGAYNYFGTSTVTIGPATLINIDGSGVAGTSYLVPSVGQKVEITGVGSIDSTGTMLLMDATAGEVRLQSTQIWGQLNSAAPGSLVMSLAAIGAFDASGFNFAGTGTAASSDANAASYAVNTGTIDQSATPAGTQLMLRGLMSRFGSAPPDFTATAVASPPTVDSILEVEWTGGNAGTSTPFSSYNTSGLVVDLSNATLTLSTISTGPFSVDLHTLSASPLIIPDPNGTNFSVGGGSSLTLDVFSTFSSFANQIGTSLGAHAVRKLVAIGYYDPATNSFVAKRINLVDW